MAERDYSVQTDEGECLALPPGYSKAEYAEFLRLTAEAEANNTDPPPFRIHRPDGRLHSVLQWLDGVWQAIPAPKPEKPTRPMQIRERAIPLSAVFPKRFVYFIAAEEGPIKIGYSVNPKVRLRQLQTTSPHRLAILAQVSGEPEVERDYHARFAAHRLHGEWFERHPDILAEIERLNAQVAV